MGGLRRDPVLVAEDNQLLSALLRDAMLAHGVSEDVRVFSRGEKFLEAYEALLVAAEPVCLLVLDILMPGLDGLSVGTRIRDLERSHKRPPAPLVFFSSRTRDDEIDTAIGACFPARFVQKSPDGPAQVAIEGARMLRDLVTGPRGRS